MSMLKTLNYSSNTCRHISVTISVELLILQSPVFFNSFVVITRVQPSHFLKNNFFFSNEWGLCLYPSLGWFPVMRALQQGQLKLLYFPHLRTRPSGDSENTTKLKLGTSSKLNQVVADGRLTIQQAVSTHQNSFRHVLPKNKFCSTVCTVCGIF